MGHTSASRKYANKYVNVYGNLLHCFKEIQIYLRLGGGEEGHKAGNVSADLFPANCVVAFSFWQFEAGPRLLEYDCHISWSVHQMSQTKKE